MDSWNCAIAWFPLLAIEGAQQTRQAAGAIESFRNEMTTRQDDLVNGVRAIAVEARQIALRAQRPALTDGT